MKKRIVSILILLVLLINLIPVALVDAANERVTVTVTADKTSAKKGDVINYTITCKATEPLSSIQLTLDIPVGLTYGEKSGKLAENLKSVIGDLDEIDYTEAEKLITIANRSPFTLTGNVTIATFACLVNDDASGDYTVGLKDVEFTDANIEVIPNTESKTVSAKTTVVVDVTGVTLNKTATTIDAGKTETLIATVAPTIATNKNVTWSSSDTSVATVSNTGVVNGVKSGSATITVKTVDGNYTATCNVTVVCTHTETTTHPAVESTCSVQGNAEYVSCNACKKVITGSDAKLPLKEHTYGTLIAKVDPIHKDSQRVDGMAAHYKCSVCNKLFDENKKEVTAEQLVIKAPSHTYGDWEEDATNHWKTCGCGNITSKEAHKGGEATCSDKALCEVCGIEYGDVDPNNHANTEIKDAVEETCTTDGYSGDTYCKDCDKKVATGTVIPAGHKGGTATCIEKAVCEACKTEYGDIDPDNHVNTETKNAVEATYDAEGYTGDVYCNDCKTLVEKGKVIPVKENPAVGSAEPDADPTRPQTDDNSNIMLWVSLLVISGICFIVVSKWNVKKIARRYSK